MSVKRVVLKVAVKCHNAGRTPRTDMHRANCNAATGVGGKIIVGGDVNVGWQGEGHGVTGPNGNAVRNTPTVIDDVFAGS